MHFCGGGLNKTVKLITAITGLLIAIGTLVPDNLVEAVIEAAEECPGECIFVEAD